eukprot:8136845-Heterocapsa_arctica.AAC.1
MIRAELLHKFARRIREATRAENTYKRRGGAADRLFGGLNVMFFGAWWQLPPVSGTPLFQPPLSSMRGGARAGVDVFWVYGPDRVSRLWELTPQGCCRDA